jgi:hypothetical protein
MAVHPLAYSRVDIPATAAFPNGRSAPRPVLTVGLVNGTSRITCYAIIDSGADHCVFPRSFMQPLGLDPLTAPVELSSGVGSANVPIHYANISIDLQGLIEFPAYAGFTTGLDQQGYGLLGQIGFFDRFNVGFRLNEGNCYIEIPDPPQQNP